MATTQMIFNLLAEKKKLQVRTETFRAHENLRIALVKLFSRHKKTMLELDVAGDESLSVCASFSDAGISTFEIGTRKTRGLSHDFQIVDENTNGNISST